jgi:hypothetical protein
MAVAPGLHRTKSWKGDSDALAADSKRITGNLADLPNNIGK